MHDNENLKGVLDEGRRFKNGLWVRNERKLRHVATSSACKIGADTQFVTGGTSPHITISTLGYHPSLVREEFLR